ncbi:MAG: PQQ-dependent sugar dehydrogenase [Rhodothermales bacterium]
MYKLIWLLPLLFIGCGKAERQAEQMRPVKEVVMENLKRPWSMAFLSENEALVTEKDGHLLRVNLLTNERQIIQGLPADRADSVTTTVEDATSLHYPFGIEEGLTLTFNEGLLEVVLDPDFVSNKRLFLSYVAEEGEGTTTKVISGRLEGNTLTDIKPLLVALPFSDGSFHYGGGMTFGQDGKLYITIGERLFSEARQPDLPIAQDLTDYRGVIYRLNADGSIPDDNPDLGPDTVPGAYAYGIRNAQGIAVNPVSGRLWFTEHGTNQGDELNLLAAGANYGWPLTTTGRYRAPNFEPPALENVELTAPAWYWHHTVAPTGLTFYTGSEFGEWKNDLLVPGLSRGSLWRFRIEDDEIKSAEELFIDQRVRTRKVAQSPGGKLYILTDSAEGQIIQIKNAAVNTSQP